MQMLHSLTLFASVASLAAAAAPEYIVQLKSSASVASISSYTADKARTNNDWAQVQIADSVEINDFKAMMGNFPPSVVNELKQHPEIQDVVPNTEVRASGMQQAAPWGLVRIDQRQMPNLGAPYNFDDRAQGRGVTAYIVDTGISPHPDFENRLLPGWKADPSWPNRDDNGHGTHVAGTIGGRYYGVAKQVKLVPVKVLDGNGSGRTDGIIRALQWVANECRRVGPRGNVVNMSLGGGANPALDDAVRAAIRSGCNVVVAAGNEGQDACNVSPARTREAITVAASDRNDRIASFSNWGQCTDIVAPGVDIRSTSNTGSGEKTLSGTSMASPHVAGTLAVYLSIPVYDGRNMADAEQRIRRWGTNNVVKNLPGGTPNILLSTHYWW